MGIERPDDDDWWLAGFADDPRDDHRAADASRAAAGSGGGRRDAGWLATTSVYVVCDQRGWPVVRELPGLDGVWAAVYSTYGRMWRSVRGEVREHCLMVGTLLLARLPPEAGVWLDHGDTDGAALVLPRVTPLD